MDKDTLFSKDALLALLHDIAMPGEISPLVIGAYDRLDQDGLYPIALAMCEMETGALATDQARAFLCETDRDGLGLLALSLCAAQFTREKQKGDGLPESVFIDTMKCFSRFAGECLRWFHKPCYDRAFWTWRQLSGSLIRLGELEFESVTLGDNAAAFGLSGPQKALSVHIPSDAVCRQAPLSLAYEKARAHFGPALPVICHSWLLSPELLKLVKQDSGIACFAKDYAIRSVDLSDESFRLWVYGPEKRADEALPEGTSLQRAIKAHLLNGGKMGSAAGVLIV